MSKVWTLRPRPALAMADLWSSCADATHCTRRSGAIQKGRDQSSRSVFKSYLDELRE